MLDVPAHRPGQHDTFDVAADRGAVFADAAWSTRSASCSMIGPSSSSAVT